MTTPTQQQEAPWIEHDGGCRPIPPGESVEPIYKGEIGFPAWRAALLACNVDWSRVARYRVVSEPPTAEPQGNETATPRTDANLSFGFPEHVKADFARQLERELIVETAAHAGRVCDLIAAQNEIAELKCELAALKAPVEGEPAMPPVDEDWKNCIGWYDYHREAMTYFGYAWRALLAAKNAELAAAKATPRFRHIKTGGHYRLISYAERESDREPMVVYQSELNGDIWVRPSAEFEAKFTEVSE